ncbi:glyoxalase/bleomycin resistance/extradiol dioxygenase family protein [Kribbella sandramycini]|uniref:Catechol 2,3-dioxygenase-like lactoylglutathione lyase family enzyme n=1 Tax=Kribbella sandramycini TaxID=60450 RepID=A0A7Y4NZG5_9ACTN|nr:VOC family protein [Kribbella sandramycini]MBB6565755.1 catechol 2,3-dioxygenase-like lactoylglutathione lyase family enzyme [Kribbella sandramycini]NOL42017.1 glyoxalase/bleomycin resistance/extradiol dioxygenase family protein [Kribbella sandramycini]
MEPPAFGATVVTDRPSEVAAFYQRHFDLEITVDLGWFICLRRGDAGWELAISQRGHESVPAAVSALRESTNIFGFIVEDADKTAAALVADGVELATEVVTEAWGQRHFFVRDPEGTWIDVIQVVAPDPEWIAANLPTQ